MDYDSAKTTLFAHAGTIEDFNRTGFLACLRPYTGLREANFHEIIEALFSVGDVFHQQAAMERSLVHAVWEIVATARRYGVDPNGMLLRNKLISNDDSKKLERWVDVIETTMLRLLRGSSPYESLYHYCFYITEYDWGANADYFVPLIMQAIDDPDPTMSDGLEDYVHALEKLGARAAPALPTLLAAEKRKYTWYHPHDRCTLEMRSHLRNAINAIESATD